MTGHRIQDILDNNRLIATDFAVWDNGTIRLRISTYICDSFPPPDYISSARSIVFREESVLVISQEDGHKHILPGGRLEKNETPEEALHREVLEETGWTIAISKFLGFIHLHHLGEKPPDYAYPYPDMIWPIYISEALVYKPEMKIYDKWVDDSGFHPVDDTGSLPINENERILLEESIKLRNR